MPIVVFPLIFPMSLLKFNHPITYWDLWGHNSHCVRILKVLLQIMWRHLLTKFVNLELTLFTTFLANHNQGLVDRINKYGTSCQLWFSTNFPYVSFNIGDREKLQILLRNMKDAIIRRFMIPRSWHGLKFLGTVNLILIGHQLG